MHIIHRLAVGLDGAAHSIQCLRIDYLADVHDLLRICLVFDGQHSSDFCAVDLDLIGDQVSNLTLTSCTALFFFPVEMCNGIERKPGVDVLSNVHPSCGNREAHGAVLLVHLVHHSHHVIQLDLGCFAAFLKVVGIANDERNLVFAHTLGQCQLNGVYHGHTLADQDIRLCLNIVIVLVAVVNVILLYDLIDGLHLLSVEVHIQDAFVIDGSILGNSSALEVQLVTLPNVRSISVQHIAVSLSSLPKLLVFVVLRRIMDSVQVIVDNRTFVFNDGLDKVLLHRLYIANLCAFPLIAVIHTIIAISVHIDASSAVVVSALLKQFPNRCFPDFLQIHLSHLPGTSSWPRLVPS